MFKALFSMFLENFYRLCVLICIDSSRQEHLIKIPMISKETRQTISYWISIENTFKFSKLSFSVKVPPLLKFLEHFVYLKEQLDNISYRLGLLHVRSKLSSLKATVTHQKCSIISCVENKNILPRLHVN